MNKSLKSSSSRKAQSLEKFSNSPDACAQGSWSSPRQAHRTQTPRKGQAGGPSLAQDKEPTGDVPSAETLQLGSHPSKGNLLASPSSTASAASSSAAHTIPYCSPEQLTPRPNSPLQPSPCGPVPRGEAELQGSVPPTSFRFVRPLPPLPPPAT
ncbi:uncharacterized protein LOC115288362 [Suricata suricatta]|uniref:uncharacterized protein LOC115288362 n=1 Tax=Suricata suricatta TaxID=37032 RepID=UPI001155F2C6|nr:uncharacterized protein LOC115288362 [Suricata suricatta]